MTLREKMLRTLQNRGLSQEDAEVVLKQYEETGLAAKTLEGRWDDDITGYDLSLLSSIWINVKHTAKIWIDEHCPEAWFRTMFE